MSFHLEISSESSDDTNGDEEYMNEEQTDDGNENEEGDRCKDEEGMESPEPDEDRKSQNVAALVGGNLTVRRQPLIPRFLSVSDGAAVARKPFKPPCLRGYSDGNEELTRRLLARKRFIPWGSSKPILVSLSNTVNIPNGIENEHLESSPPLPSGIQPLILWQPEELECSTNHSIPIVVDPLLVHYLRPHQREGVQFMFDCVSGLSSTDGISGCILADDMGLGKTLQSITLLYTLLRQGFDGKAMVNRALIVTPTSLVSNWESEIEKWVGKRIHVLSLCESTKADVVSGIHSFLKPRSTYQVLIISYETFRLHSPKFEKAGSCDLLICDEAHRLKNNQTLTNRALASLPCSRRILLSGTPMQNDLEEFFAMVNFTNPGILGDVTYFRRYYETPIINGREPTANTLDKKLGLERSGELSSKVNQFILRRTNALLSNHLPPKWAKPKLHRREMNKLISLTLANYRNSILVCKEIVEVVCCRLTPLQLQLYNYFIQSKNVKRVISDDSKHSRILAYITALKKLCNHPKLIYDTIKSGSPGTSGLEGCLRFFPSELFSGRSGAWTGGDGIWVELSGKMHVLARLLSQLRQKTDDRIVLVSNYTQTLDLFAQLCRERKYPCLRLDGTTSISKRQKLVNCFNDFTKDEFVFLLSSKAGGCGLNLIGGNRLVLFDPDWNPANDKQAAARVWRDGQKKRVFIYRFLTTGTIEEKVYQRQMSKEGLQKVIQKEQMDLPMQQGNTLSSEDLRDLFTLHENVRSEIHENMNCNRCERDTFAVNETSDSSEPVRNGKHIDFRVYDNDVGGFAQVSGCLQELTSSEIQVGTPLEEDLGSWGHHISPNTVPDVILQASSGNEVTFVFTNQVDGKLIPVESIERTKPRFQELQKECIQNQRSVASSRQRQFHSFNKNTANDDRSILSFRSKLPRTSLNGQNVLRKPCISHVNQIDSRQTIVSSDDDFM